MTWYRFNDMRMMHVIGSGRDKHNDVPTVYVGTFTRRGAHS